MDTSKEYIEMCEKAQEIQEYYQKEHTVEISIGDIVYVKNIKSATNVTCIYEPWEGFWLPRQDQLQEMIGIDEYLLENKTRGLRLAEYCEGWCLSDKYMEQFETMEQLWLATVMKEKYNKQWNPETKEWEKIYLNNQ